MSTVEISLAPPRPSLGLRLFRSELGLLFRRRRNQSLLVLLAVVPIVVGFALWASTPRPGEGPPLVGQVTNNGLFLSMVAYTFLLPLVMPLVVAVVAGDSIAGEASTGTLRYLLAVPAGRTRLLAVKYAAAVVFCVASVTTVAVSALIIGAMLFPIGSMTLLSGTSVSLTAGLGRVVLVALYVVAGISALAAIGLAVSTITDSPIAAITATTVLAVACQVVDAVPQLSGVHPYLLTHWWTSFDDLLRAPMVTGNVTHGLFVFAAYIAAFGSLAWSRFTTKDITA